MPLRLIEQRAVRITRSKLYGSGGRPMGRFAWKWCYTVHGTQRHGTTTLDEARAIAKGCYGDKNPVLAWKREAP